MLRIFHNKKIQKIVWLSLVAMIGPAFIFWGINSQRSQRSAKEGFGKLFGKNVSRQEYIDAKRDSVLQLKMRFGNAFEEMQKYFDYNVLALQRLALIKEAGRRGIRVKDTEVISAIESDPSFQNKAGRFDSSLYKAAMNYLQYTARMQPRQYEEQVRHNLMIRKLSELETGNVTVSEDEVRDAYRKEHEQLDLDYIAALPADFVPTANVSDQELKDYFAAKSLDFKQPLSFNLEYVSTDKEHEVVSMNSRLEKESFDAVAKSLNLQIKETGLFAEADPIPGVGWSAELSRSLPVAKPGQVFAPLLMDKKYYLMRLKERKEPYIPEFDAIKEKVKAAVVKDRSREIAKKKIDDCLAELDAEKAKGPVDFAKTAASLGLKADSTGLFRFGSYIEKIGSSDSFYTAGDALKDGEFSRVIDVQSGFYIVKVKNRVTIDEKKYADEKTALREKLLDEKKSEAFSAYVEALMKRALQ